MIPGRGDQGIDVSTAATIINAALGAFNAWMLVRSRRVMLGVVPHVSQGVAIGGDRDTYETRICVTTCHVEDRPAIAGNVVECLRDALNDSRAMLPKGVGRDSARARFDQLLRQRNT